MKLSITEQSISNTHSDNRPGILVYSSVVNINFHLNFTLKINPKSENNMISVLVLDCAQYVVFLVNNISYKQFN